MVVVMVCCQAIMIMFALELIVESVVRTCRLDW